jgi:hypothetical protein
VAKAAPKTAKAANELVVTFIEQGKLGIKFEKSPDSSTT